MNKFHTDVPNDEWLQSKQRAAEQGMHKHKGIVGSVTGWFDAPLKLSTRNIRFTPGLNDEHFYRDDVDGVKSKLLQKSVDESGKFDTSKHPIFITVNHNGEGYVSEGNHRLAYAIRNKIPHIHAEVRYYNGGERARGLFNPALLAPTELNEAVEHPKIMLNGEQKHETNSIGYPIHHTYEGVANFHRWFGKSKTVDEHGRPRVFYHGTGTDIKAFSHQFSGKGTDAYGTGFYFTSKPEVANTYSLLKDSPNTVPVYLKVTKPIDKDTHKELSPVHIEKIIRASPNYKDALTNFGEHEGKALRSAVDAYSGTPVYDAMGMLHNDFYRGHHEQFLKTFTKVTGYDGVIVDHGDHMIVNAFHPSNIKSAIGNDGTFDHKTNLTERTMDPIAEAYSKMQSITQETPEDKEYNDKLSQIWYRSAHMPWHEYAAGMNLGGQEHSTPENEASKQRVKDYVEKHKHLFMTKNTYQT